MAGNGIGLSVSEPVFSAAYYYQEPNQSDSAAQAVALSALNGKLVDAYGSDSGGVPYLDQPYETAYYNTTQPNQNIPLNLDQIQATKTYLNYKTVLLQRLANPLLPYNPMPNDISNPGDPHEPAYNSNYPVNPYITVDWMPANLTVFNGDQIPGPQVAGATPMGVPAKSSGNAYIDPDDVTFENAPANILASGGIQNFPSPVNGTATAGTFGTAHAALQTPQVRQTLLPI